MAGNIILEGFFLKKKRDDKSSLLSSKYQKRFFQLTADSLAYAKDPQAISSGSADVQVFPTHLLAYVKRSKKVNLEIRFPERVLRVKAETAEEAERWEAALQKANMMKVHGGAGVVSPVSTPSKAKPNIPGAPPVRNPVDNIATIEADSSDDDSGPEPAPRARARAATSTAPRPNLRLFTEPVDTQQDLNKPPSPRSLLANPRLGNKMVSMPREPPQDHYSDHQGGRGGGGERGGGYDASGSDDDHSHYSNQQQQSQRLPQQQRQQFQQQQQRTSGSPMARRPAPGQDDECLTLEAPKPAPQPRAEPRPRVTQERLILESALPSSQSFSAPGSPARSVMPARSATIARGNGEPLDREVLTLSGPPPASPSGKPPMPNRGRVSSPRGRDYAADPEPQPRRSARGPSPMGVSSGNNAQYGSPRGPSPSRSTASKAISQGTSGDDNWLDSDWDSSDPEQQQHAARRQQGKQQQQRAAAAQGPSGGQHRQQPQRANDDWDSDEERQQQQQQRQRAPAPPRPPQQSSSRVPAAPQAVHSGQLHSSSRFSPSNGPASAAAVQQARGYQQQHEHDDEPAQPCAGVQMDKGFADDDWDDDD